MKRRLNSIMVRCGAANLFEYSRLLSLDSARQQEFRDFLTINVSEFFRIPEKFDYLRQQVLPDLLTRNRSLSVWSAGCSDGSEPYTLAILLHELAPLGRWRILATDIDATVLQRARRGIYPSSGLRNLTTGRLAKYFVPVRSEFQVKEQIKKRIEFRVHDLLRDGYEPGLDLILCRHVLIYFTEQAKDGVFQRLATSLRPGGVLFIGGTEMIKAPKSIGLESSVVSFYRKSDYPKGEVAQVGRSGLQNRLTSGGR